MSVNKLNPIEYWYGSCKKEIGQVFTSEEHRARGLEYRKPYFNTEVTRDGITHFIDGIGDLNPLYRNPSMVRRLSINVLLLPLSLLTVSLMLNTPMIGRRAYLDSIRVLIVSGFVLSAKETRLDYRVMYPSDVILMPSKFAGQKVMAYEQCDYYRGGAIIGGYRCWETWAEDRKADEQNKYKNEVAKLPVYTEEDLKKIYEAQDREVEMLRGAKPRYWEDVNVGDELTPVVRGPFTLTEKEAWNIGCHGNVHFSDRLTRIWHERDPHHTIDYDPTFSQPQTIRPGVFTSLCRRGECGGMARNGSY